MVDYDPFSPQAMADPHPAYRALRAAGPVHPLPQYDAVALPRFGEVWQVLCDLESFSIAGGPVFVREQLLRPARLEDHDPADPNLSFSMWDPPLHSRIRQLMSPPLRPRAAAMLEPRVRALARERLDELVGAGRLDVARDYAAPVVVTVACEVLGFPAGAERGAGAWSITCCAQRSADEGSTTCRSPPSS